MRRELIIGAIALLVVLAVASQLALPRLAEDQVVDRLTAGGGTAQASISAFPALRLLFGHGDRLDVSGRGLVLPIGSQSSGSFSKLDGFDSVSVSLDDFEAGPVSVRRFELTRDGSDPYRLQSVASTTLAGLAGFGGSQFGGFLGRLALGIGAREALGPAARRPIPIRLDMELADESGRVVVVGGSGTVAGIPTGPLAELITAAIVVRL
jgi:hypothetical protein